MIPYGYRIENGMPVVDEDKAAQVRELFRLYLEGVPIEDAGAAAAIPLSRSAIGKMLSNIVYAGFDFYPEIVPPAEFERAQLLRARKNRNAHSTRKPVRVAASIKTEFRFDGLDPSIIADTKYDAVYQSIRPGDDKRASARTKALIAQTLQ